MDQMIRDDAVGDGPSTVQSVERALDILELVVRAEKDVGLRELSQEAGVPTATAHRLLAVLRRRGYVRRNVATRRYETGMAIVELAAQISGQRTLQERARPYLQELVQLTHETASLGVLEGGHAVYVAQVQPPRVVRMFVEVGNKVPPHCCGLGKVLLAYLPESDRETILTGMRLEAFTPNTITDRERFRVELGKIREQEYALDEGEFEEGVRCVAVPVLKGSRRALAALSVSGPSSRMTNDRVAGWIRRMRTVGGELAQALARE